jgi:hypothetical protein
MPEGSSRALYDIEPFFAVLVTLLWELIRASAEIMMQWTRNEEPDPGGDRWKSSTAVYIQSRDVSRTV